MNESKEFVEVLSKKYSLGVGFNNVVKTRIAMFWSDVEKLVTEQDINEEDLKKSCFIADMLWSNYNELPQFKCDYEVAKYFSELIKVAIKKEPTAIELFKLEQRITSLEVAVSSLAKRDKRIG